MSRRHERKISRYWDYLRESAEQDIADRDPQEAVRISRTVPETVAVSDSITITERSASDARFVHDPNGPGLEGELR